MLIMGLLHLKMGCYFVMLHNIHQIIKTQVHGLMISVLYLEMPILVSLLIKASIFIGTLVYTVHLFLKKIANYCVYMVQNQNMNMIC